MRKQGSVVVFGLMIMIMFFVLAASFINIAVAVDTVKRAATTVEEAARVRALAIDIPLKEQKNVVVIMTKEEDFDDHYTFSYDDPEMQNEIGHLKVETPGSIPYDDAVEDAFDISAQAGINYFQAGTGNNVTGQPLIEMEQKNFCFNIVELPDINTEMELRCTANIDRVEYDENGNKITTEDFEETVVTTEFIKAKNNYEFELKDRDGNPVMYEAADGTTQVATVKVVNFVYAGMVYQYNHFIFDVLKSLGLNMPPVKAMSAIAYPQADRCTEMFCTSDGYLDEGNW